MSNEGKSGSLISFIFFVQTQYDLFRLIGKRLHKRKYKIIYKSTFIRMNEISSEKNNRP